MVITTGMMSSLAQDWETPQSFVDAVAKQYSLKFTLDCCAYPTTAKAPKFFTEADDGLSQDWTGVVWMNPPYSRAIPTWLQKAHDESKAHDSTVVCLVPARPDTKWFHDIACKGHVVFLRGRIKFLQGGKEEGSPAFPSMLVIYGPNFKPGFSTWDWRK